MIFVLLSWTVLVIGCLNYKKGLIFYIILQLIWHSTRIISGLPVTTSIMLSVFFIVMYLLNIKKVKKTNIDVPYKVPFIFILVSFVLTSFVAITGLEYEFPRVLDRYMLEIFIPWIVWKCIETEKDFKYMFKLISVTMLIACVYGLIEVVIQANPLLDYKFVLSKKTIGIYESISRGYRLYSVFEHPIGAGMTFGLYSIFVFSLWFDESGKKYVNSTLITTATLCLVCVLLTRMRSAIFFTLFAALGLMSPKNFSKRNLMRILLATIVAVPLVGYVIYKNAALFSLNAVLTTSSSSGISGSSIQMRLSQLSAIKIIFSQSPLLGLGETFRNVYQHSQLTRLALGYESVWFEELVMHGVIGIVATLVMIYYSVIRVPRKYKSVSAGFISLAFWITYTLTSIPSFHMVIYYLVLFYYIKSSDVYKHEKGRGAYV